MLFDFQVGDVIKMKKQHPCGAKEWEVLRIGADFRLKCKGCGEILRVGADFRLRCMGCGHQIMITRRLVEKNAREIRKKA